MNYKCEIFEQPAQTVLSIRTRISVENLSSVLGGIYGSLMQYFGEIGEQPSGPPFVAYYNMDMQDLDIEAGFPVSKILSGKEEIKFREIPAGKQISCIHKGPYSKIEPAYNAIMKYAEENGYESNSTSYEFYLNDPNDTPEEELLTRVCFPLK